LTLRDWLDVQAAHYHGLGNDAAWLVAETLEGLAQSIRFHGATSRAEYLDHVASLRPCVDNPIPDDFDADNPLY
jgi:hypothetical protein